MSEFKSEFTFQLETPIAIHEKGQITQATELLLKAPSNKQRHESAKLKQGFFRALKSMADAKGNVDTKSEVESETTISGAEVMSVIMMSNVDLSEYQENFRTLLLNDACFVNGVKLTNPMFDSLSDSDTERLMGEYVSNFLLASHLSKMATK